MLRELLNAIKEMFTWWITVAPWEQGIRVRAGKHVKLLTSGLHVRIPILDRFYLQSIRLRYISIPTQTITTKDGKALTVSGGLAYSITDVLKLYSTIHDPVDTIQLMCCGAVASAVEAGMATELRPQSVESAVCAQLSLEKFGIGDVEFKITDWALVRTYRLIQGEPKNYGGELNTTVELPTASRAY